MDIQDVIPPDDGGRDAFERFRYQAHVAFPSCLNCAGDQGVTAVICEHIEDVCIEEEGRVRFCQIKTRNPDYGLWRLSDLCSERGAFRSLLRTHRALADVEDEREFVYEVVLEGALKRDDPIQEFLPAGQGTDDTGARRVIKLMKSHTELRLAEAREFLGRIRIRQSGLRSAIVALNLQMLMRVGGSLPAAELEAIYERTIELICQAMAGDLIPGWPEILFRAETSEDARASVASKRLDKAALVSELETALSGVTPSLKEITDPDALSASALEQKLKLAGAPRELIEQAQQLRANATLREIELLSQSLRGKETERSLEDLRQRLLMGAVTSLGLHGATVPTPAPAVFADLLERLGAQPDSYDPANLYRRDPALLMGGVCDLSDQCRFAWRNSE